MQKLNAVITGVGVYVPEYILTNEELSRMVDTTDEWIMTRIGIKERHILREPGKGSSDLGVNAVNELLQKTKTKPEEIELLICATVTPDMQFPATANIICDKALASTLRENGRHEVKAFAWSRVTDQLLAYYNDVFLEKKGVPFAAC